MQRYESELVELIRSGRLVKRDSCLACVRKHIGKAKVLVGELAAAGGDQSVADARIKVELNHLEIIGNLQAAADEAEAWPALYDAIRDAERRYRYDGIEPDWTQLAGLILAAGDNQT